MRKLIAFTAIAALALYFGFAPHQPAQQEVQLAMIGGFLDDLAVITGVAVVVNGLDSEPDDSNDGGSDDSDASDVMPPPVSA